MAPDDLLLKHRTIVLRGEISDRIAQEVIAKLLFLQHEDAKTPAWLYIDSAGGVVTSSLAIRDTINDIKLPVFTHCLGKAAGAALVLLTHGAHGHRSASKTAWLSLVPLDSLDGSSAPDELGRLERTLTDMLAADTGQKSEAIARDASSSRRFDSAQARSYGLIDRIEE